LRIAISRWTHARNSSRNAGHRRLAAKFSDPKAFGNNSAIVHRAMLLSSPLQHITRTLPFARCAASAMSWRHEPQGATTR